MDASSGLLWQCPPIITNIFKYLCARDLSSCAKVCSLWNSISITENNRRRFVEWFLEISIGQTVGMEGCILESTPPVGILYPFQQQLASARAKPSICLAFVTTDTLEQLADAFSGYASHSTQSKRLKKDHRDRILGRLKAVKDNFLNPFLPARCQLHCIASPGIIGCHDNGSPAEVEEGRAISGLLLPHLPGVSIRHFSLEHDTQWQDIDFPDRPIKGMLMFVRRPTVRLIGKCIDECVRCNGGEAFAIGGAIVEHVEPVSDGYCTLGSCFLFSGDNVDVASVVIDAGKVTSQEVGYELALFKKTGLLENQCFAFMFACVDKGFQKYLVQNFESSIFRSMYPDVPLTGVFGNGEIGIHFLPNVDKDDPDHKQRCKKFSKEKCVRGYCTIFVLVSVKTPK